MSKTHFEATVRKQSGLMTVGKIHNVQLVPFIGKKVKVTIEEVK